VNGNLPLSLIGTLAAGEVTNWARRMKHRAAFYALCALFALTGWALTISAGVMALADRYGMPVAALAAGCGFLVLAAAIIVAVHYRQRLDRAKASREQTQAALLATTAMIILPSMLRHRPLTLLALLGGGGVLAGFLSMRKDRPLPG
jgi:cytochrome bd-type quinol oxidase subunit 2